jgi:SAM-dependent methyltransferase
LFNRIESNGYSFFFESLLVLHRNGFGIEEMAIALPARTYGHSKMSFLETFGSVVRLLQLFFARHRASHRYQSADIPPIVGADVPLPDPQGWDSYWIQSRDNTRRIYSCIASVYRRLAIKRNLNHFIRKHFGPGAQLLHAGCGSGQVDTDLCREMRITAVDISLPALETYRRNNPHAEAIRHGDILNLSDIAAERFDGAYNLGVVEHFSEEEIVRILREMGRTLRPGGKVVIFWPHRHATSVFALKVIHWLLNCMRIRKGAPIRLHPAEISLLKSRRQAQQFVEKAGFKLVEYHFGLRDLLVQAVVIGCKV